MKKKAVLGMVTLLLMMALAGCGKESAPANEDLSKMEEVEGFDNLSEEEANKKLIEEADKMEVVPDKTEQHVQLSGTERSVTKQIVLTME